MGIQFIGLFCLLVCCELSACLAYRRSFRFGNTSLTRSYDNALRTESTPSLPAYRKVFNNVDEDVRVRWGNGLALNVSRMFVGNVLSYAPGNGRVDATGVINNGAPAHTDKTPETFATQSDTTLSWIHTLRRKHMSVYWRPRRAARSNPSEPGAVVGKLESFPEASAQNQPTEPPTALPAEDYEDSTPLGPINTRPRGPGLPNPFYPVTGESYAAYAIIFVSVIMFTAGIIGNIAIMCTVCHNYYMRSVSNSLLANLALWDFLVTFFCLPLVIFHQLTKDWLLGEFSCKIVPYFEVKINK